MNQEQQPLVTTKMRDIPAAPWADAVPSARDPARFLPQTIAHRGYKAMFPENTMLAFQGAVDVGAHAIETDLHLSADGVVVLSHDPTGKRCFGVDKKISDCSWEDIRWWRTLRQPHEPMPRLEDLLAWLARPENERIWLMLDIKVDDPARDLVGAIAKVIAKVEASTSRPWEQRILLGCWNAAFTLAAREILPTFALVHMSISVFYAQHFFRVPGMAMNIFQPALIGPIGWLFIREVRNRGRQLYVWTVNRERWMEWCIRKNIPSRRKRLSSDQAEKSTLQGGEYYNSTGGSKVIDGVITDDPKLFRQVCERWEDEQDAKRETRSVGLIDQAKDKLRAAAISAIVQIGALLLVARHLYFGRLNFFKRGDERRL